MKAWSGWGNVVLARETDDERGGQEAWAAWLRENGWGLGLCW